MINSVVTVNTKHAGFDSGLCTSNLVLKSRGLGDEVSAGVATGILIVKLLSFLGLKI